MNTLFLQNLLLSLPLQGMLWTLLLFLLCFLGVCATELIQLGWQYKRFNEPVEKEEQTPAKTPQEPVYYIVEKKKRKPKHDYEEPKPFRFKEP